MSRYRSLILILYLCFVPAAWIQARPEASSGAEKKAGAPTIDVKSLNIGDNTLKLSYEIKNDSEHDIWICEDIDAGYAHQFEASMAEDGQTLLVRKRLDVPLWACRNLPNGRYVRLRPGQIRMESLTMPLPVCPQFVFFGAPKPREGTEYAKHLTLEIGFFSGNLYEMVSGVVQEAERLPQTEQGDPTKAHTFIGGPLHFTRLNEWVRDRDNEVMVTYSHQTLKGEQVLRTTIDDQLIPYEHRIVWPRPSPPDLSLCTRLEIEYHPSMLECFFPYRSQQNLLSPQESKYLRSQKTVVVDDRNHIRAFSEKIREGFDGRGGVMTQLKTAHVSCYHDDERMKSFTVYDNWSIETEEKQRLRYCEGLLEDLVMLTPQIRPFELRVRCAKNLKDLWHRLRLYYIAQDVPRVSWFGKTKILYPTATGWCDAMFRAYKSTGMSVFVLRAYKCSSVAEGKCHYAMNPKCKPHSPPDTVLLFETKAGWNQHGGPELFTLDNHDPKGGCVLLNDGTVKFVRTKEELHNLRWK